MVVVFSLIVGGHHYHYNCFYNWFYSLYYHNHRFEFLVPYQILASRRSPSPPAFVPSMMLLWTQLRFAWLVSLATANGWVQLHSASSPAARSHLKHLQLLFEIARPQAEWFQVPALVGRIDRKEAGNVCFYQKPVE